MDHASDLLEVDYMEIVEAPMCYQAVSGGMPHQASETETEKGSQEEFSSPFLVSSPFLIHLLGQTGHGNILKLVRFRYRFGNTVIEQ